METPVFAFNAKLKIIYKIMLVYAIKRFKMSLKTLLGSGLLLFCISVYALPKFLVQHQRNAENLAEIQVTNQTAEPLICYVAIDGHKIYFRLQALQPSKWYKAMDPRFNYTHFSTWCDYLSLHPKYLPKNN